MKRADAILLAVVLAVAGIWFVFSRFLSEKGTSAVITTPDQTFSVPLSHNNMFVLNGKDGIAVVITVQNGAIRFESSECPNQICVHSGWLSVSGQSAACVPAEVAVRIVGNGGIDAVTS